MALKRTRGPWRNIAAFRAFVAHLGMGTKTEQEGNAVLMMNSSDLLDAAEYAVRQLADGEDPEIDDDGDEIDPFERLREVIARAKGEA